MKLAAAMSDAIHSHFTLPRRADKIIVITNQVAFSAKPGYLFM
jgi:hypothetical protein